MKENHFQKLDDFFTQFKYLHYKKREMILRTGDTPSGVFYLKKGYVRLFSISREGQELTLIIFKQNDFFPLGWAINNLPDSYCLETMTPVELWRAPRDQFLSFIKANPDVFFELTSRILVRLGGLLQRMEYLVFGTAYQKVASIMVICAQRFGLGKGKGIKICVPLTHKDIANLVGITRETASVEMKKLERKGLIDCRGHLIIVKNPEKLKEESLLNGS